MSWRLGSVYLDMAQHTHSLFLRRVAALALVAGGIAHADDSLAPHTRDAAGIASAVTEIMPAIGDCLESDRALGGPEQLRVMIAFDVIESGEIGSLVIDGLQSRAHRTPLPSCLEGTLAAMRFAPGARAIPVQLPLEAHSTVQSTTH
jgi:hypothetical protein